MNKKKIMLPGRPWKDENEKACSVIQIRITESRKEAYKRAAGEKGLTEWITKQCDKALK